MLKVSYKLNNNCLCVTHTKKLYCYCLHFAADETNHFKNKVQLNDLTLNRIIVLKASDCDCSQ